MTRLRIFFLCATFGAQNQRPVRVIPEGEGLHWLYHFFPSSSRSSSPTKHIILSPSPKNIIPLHYMTLTLFRNHLRRRLI